MDSLHPEWWKKQIWLKKKIVKKDELKVRKKKNLPSANGCGFFTVRENLKKKIG